MMSDKDKDKSKSISKDQDPDYIYNTNSKRWVLKSGKSGQEFLREQTKAVEKVEEKKMNSSVDSAIESFEQLKIETKEAGSKETEVTNSTNPISRTLMNMVSEGSLFKYEKDGQVIYTYNRQ